MNGSGKSSEKTSTALKRSFFPSLSFSFYCSDKNLTQIENLVLTSKILYSFIPKWPENGDSHHLHNSFFGELRCYQTFKTKWNIFVFYDIIGFLNFIHRVANDVSYFNGEKKVAKQAHDRKLQFPNRIKHKNPNNHAKERCFFFVWIFLCARIYRFN